MRIKIIFIFVLLPLLCVCPAGATMKKGPVSASAVIDGMTTKLGQDKSDGNVAFSYSPGAWPITRAVMFGFKSDGVKSSATQYVQARRTAVKKEISKRRYAGQRQKEMVLAHEVADNRRMDSAVSGMTALSNLEGMESGLFDSCVRAARNYILPLCFLIGIALAGLKLLYEENWNSAQRGILDVAITTAVVMLLLFFMKDVLFWSLNLFSLIAETLGGTAEAPSLEVIERAMDMGATYVGDSDIFTFSWSDLLALPVHTLVIKLLAILLRLLTAGIIWGLFLLSDCLLAGMICAVPFMLAIAVVPVFRGQIAQAFQGLLRFMLIPVAITIFLYCSSIAATVIAPSSMFSYLVLSAFMFYSATKIPQFSDSLSGGVFTSQEKNLADLSKAGASKAMNFLKSAIS